MVFLRKNFAALDEFSAGNTNILIFRRLCGEDHLHRFKMDAIHLHSADKKQIMTDADEDKPPIGRLPSMMPDSPTFRRYFSPSIFAAPRR